MPRGEIVGWQVASRQAKLKIKNRYFIGERVITDVIIITFHQHEELKVMLNIPLANKKRSPHDRVTGTAYL